MSTKHYAIYNPATGFYSVGYTHSYQSWDVLDVARIWDRVGDVKAHITHCNKLARHAKRSNPYIAPMEIVEVERVYTNKGLAEKI
jgi:hypothetical protein